MAHLRRCSHGALRKPSAWDRGGDKTHRPAGRVSSPSTWSPELLGPGKGTKHGPTKFVLLWSTQEPEPEWLRPVKCMQPRAHFRQFPYRATWSLSSVDWESTHAVSGDKCGSDTVSTPHTHQWYLLAVFLPPQSITEQVSLNIWPPLPPCVRAEIRHWRDLQTEEAKINKEEGTALEVTRVTD